MLYIIDIDDYSFGLSGTGALTTDIEVVHPKEYYAISTNAVGDATGGLVSIIHKDNKPNIISSRKPSEITLDGTVYSDANDFAIAFNSLMTSAASSGADTTSIVNKLQEVINCVCRDCSSWYNGTVESATTTLSAGTINSCTIIVESGSVIVGNGTTTQTLTTGMSITIEADNPLNQDIVINATSGKAHYVVTTCATTTTTTT